MTSDKWKFIDITDGQRNLAEDIFNFVISSVHLNGTQYDKIVQTIMVYDQAIPLQSSRIQPEIYQH